MERRKLIYSAKELFTEFLRDKKFVIPAYQRGYKWTKEDVLQLLKDVESFQDNGDEDVFYCLQNITLIEDKDNHSFRIVDGQQRLTTLSLILCCFKENDIVKNKLHYDIRKESNLFLQTYVYAGNIHSFGGNTTGALKEWNELDLESTGTSFDYQDIFYMYSAIQTVEDYLKEKNDSFKNQMNEKLQKKVKLIVNLPSISEKQELELFNNLNGKRVPLDGADLVRAMLITRKSKKDVENIDEAIKHDVLLNENRVKIGLLLDRINAWWTVSNRQKYFKTFISNIKTKGHIRFDESQYGIDALYKLYVACNKDAQKSGLIQLDDFENIDICKLYNELIELQRIIEYWYNDTELYHIVQFVGTYCKIGFNELIKNWHEKNKEAFVKYLKNIIKENSIVKFALREKEFQNGGEILLTEDSLNQDEDWHDGEEVDLILISVLLDIIDIIDSKKSNPLTFLDADHFIAKKEDKEHIFPQTPLGKNFTEEHFNSYKELIIAYEIQKNAKYTRNRLDLFFNTYLKKIMGNEAKKEIFRKVVNKILTEEIVPIGSLGNMCLLEYSVNRSYGNDFFTQKHFDIMTKSKEGCYIRPHVLDAFTKVMGQPQDRENPVYMQKWDKEDIYMRRKYVVKQIRDFLG